MAQDANTAAGDGSTRDRVRRFVVWGAVIGALLGAVLFVAKVAIADDFDFGSNWIWVFAVVLGAIAGSALGLVFSALGQSDD